MSLSVFLTVKWNFSTKLIHEYGIFKGIFENESEARHDPYLFMCGYCIVFYHEQTLIMLWSTELPIAHPSEMKISFMFINFVESFGGSFVRIFGNDFLCKFSAATRNWIEFLLKLKFKSWKNFLILKKKLKLKW